MSFIALHYCIKALPWTQCHYGIQLYWLYKHWCRINMDPHSLHIARKISFRQPPTLCYSAHSKRCCCWWRTDGMCYAWIASIKPHQHQTHSVASARIWIRYVFWQYRQSCYYFHKHTTSNEKFRINCEPFCIFQVGVVTRDAETNDLLEKQADLINYLKDHNNKLNQKLMMLNAQIRSSASGITPQNWVESIEFGKILWVLWPDYILQ